MLGLANYHAQRNRDASRAIPRKAQPNTVQEAARQATVTEMDRNIRADNAAATNTILSVSVELEPEPASQPASEKPAPDHAPDYVPKSAPLEPKPAPVEPAPEPAPKTEPLEPEKPVPEPEPKPEPVHPRVTSLGRSLLRTPKPHIQTRTLAGLSLKELDQQLHNADAEHDNAKMLEILHHLAQCNSTCYEFVQEATGVLKGILQTYAVREGEVAKAAIVVILCWDSGVFAYLTRRMLGNVDLEGLLSN